MLASNWTFMKIAIDVSQMCYEGTGVARYVRGLTQELLSSSHEFVLYAGALRRHSYFTELSRTKPWDRGTWRILPIPPKLAGYLLDKFPLELLTGSVGIIHTSDWVEPFSHKPMVTTVHDLVFQKYPKTVDPLILHAQTKRLERLVHNKTHIITDSQSTKNDLEKIYSFPSSRISMVYPGIEPSFSPQSPQEIDRVKTKYNLPAEFILSVGTQEPRKNLERLTQAVSTLDLPLILVGKHGWGDHLTPGVKGAHTPGVFALGYVPEEDLPGLYSAATIFAYPSLYEGFGFPVIEAMACGTPVVTSNISSLPEVAGRAAILVDPSDITSIHNGINQALSSRAKLISLGLAHAQKFTWAQTAKQVLEVYEKITHRN
ncbi:MAG: group 1 glycosyl transferase [uncultured bacterium]|nr:MAG: group 1 glycosyl transferase [uncultured bacterium]KKU26462.1 MAG: Glycosyl transferase group 1 [Microgenomates group bacterium GW2011_GWA2_46_16]